MWALIFTLEPNALSPSGGAAQVLHDKFFWTSAVTAMAVTATARGIASKFLLLGTAAGQVGSRRT